MKKLMIVVAMLAMALCTIKAQTDRITVSQESMNLSKIDMELPDEAVSYLTDPAGELVALECVDPKTAKKKHPKHILKVYRMSDKKLMWISDVYKAHKVRYRFLRQGILEIDEGAITLRSKLNGTEIWSKSATFIGIVDDKVIACGGAITALNAYSIDDGAKIWGGVLKMDCGVTYNQPIDGSHDYIVANNLFRIDWNTGNRVKLSSSTGVEYGFSNSMLFGTMFGALGSLIGSGIDALSSERSTLAEADKHDLFMRPYNNRMGGLTSNIVALNGRNYYADHDGIKCFDDSLNIIWKTKIKGGYGSRSKLLVKNDTAYVINFALGFVPSGAAKFYGAPFVASFNINNGEALDFKCFTQDSVSVVSTRESDAGVKLLMPMCEASYRFADRYLDYSEHDTTGVGLFKYYITEGMCYIRATDGGFSVLEVSDQFAPVYTANGYVADISHYIPKVVAPKEDVFLKVAELNDILFIKGGKGNNELWGIKDGKASLVADDVKRVKKNNGKLEILTKAGKVRLLSIAQ